VAREAVARLEEADRASFAGGEIFGLLSVGGVIRADRSDLQRGLLELTTLAVR
jgi:hypothetical protein